jgi:hypothetical protein
MEEVATDLQMMMGNRIYIGLLFGVHPLNLWK